MFTSQIQWRKTQLVVDQNEWRFGEVLGCTDAAKWPPHPHLTRPDARGTPLPACRTTSRFFFFFFFVSGFALIRLRRTPTRAEPGRFAPIWAESDLISQILVCFGRKKEISQRKKKKKKLKTENASGFDTPLSPSSLALTPFFFFFFFFFASSPSSSFFLASPAFQFLLFL